MIHTRLVIYMLVGIYCLQFISVALSRPVKAKSATNK